MFWGKIQAPLGSRQLGDNEMHSTYLTMTILLGPWTFSRMPE